MKKKFFIWPAMKKGLFSLPRNIKNTVYGLIKVTETLVYLLDNIILDLALSFIDKM